MHLQSIVLHYGWGRRFSCISERLRFVPYSRLGKALRANEITPWTGTQVVSLFRFIGHCECEYI
jgi:hypothetical protein